MQHNELDHPERRPGEVFLGNHEAGRLPPFSTVRAGVRAYCADGSPYPFQQEERVVPVFASAAEARAHWETQAVRFALFPWLPEHLREQIAAFDALTQEDTP